MQAYIDRHNGVGVQIGPMGYSEHMKDQYMHHHNMHKLSVTLCSLSSDVEKVKM